MSKRRTTSIFWRLSRNMLIVIGLLAAAIFSSTIYTADQIRGIASRTAIDRALRRVESDLTSFFAPVRSILLFSRHLVETGLLDPSDTESINALFMPVLSQVPQISSFDIGDPRGRGFMLLHLEDRWRNRRVDPEAWGNALDFKEWSDEKTLIRAWRVDDPPEDERYDPRVRAWYRTAVEDAKRLEPGVELPDRVYWTDPYVFFTSGEPGISAAIHARGPDGSRYILSLDLTLKKLSDFTRNMETTPHGRAIIIDEQHRVIGLPRDAAFDDPRNRSGRLLKPVPEIGIQAITDGTAAFLELGPTPPDIFSFESEGETYWAEVQPFEISENRTFLIVVLIPDRDLLGVVQKQRLVFGAITLAALIVASLMTIALSRRFSEPLRELAENSERIGKLDLTPSPVIESSLTEIDQLAEEQERMRVALDAFSKYVPVELVRELLHRGEATKLGGSERDITILFSDVIGFTTIAEAMTPPEVTTHMGEYFAAFLEVIQEDGFGNVNEIAGDGVVAFWGAPAEDADHARHAVDAVLRCRARIAALNLVWRGRGKPELPTRFGLATGPVVVGNVGAPTRLSYAATGDTVNIASRVQAINRLYGTEVLVTAAVRDRAGPGFAWRNVDAVRVKGKTKALEIYELLGREGEVSDAETRFAERYAAALALFRERRFREAVDALDALSGDRPGDRSVERLAARARDLRDHPPEGDWEPVSQLMEK